MNNYNFSRHTLYCLKLTASAICPLPADMSITRNYVTKGQVISVVESVTGHTVEEMKTASRKQPLVFSRYMMMRMLRSRTSMSLNQVGKMLGRDHSTVLYGIEVSDNLLKFDPQFKRIYKKIESLL